MGEKGNITSAELLTTATGVGAAVSGSGSAVGSAVEGVAGRFADTAIDKGADAGMTAAGEKWKEHRENGADGSGDRASGDGSEPPTSG